MKKMTRAQINERLEKLRQSRLDDASYTEAVPLADNRLRLTTWYTAETKKM